jgi:hypothetical protein
MRQLHGLESPCSRLDALVQRGAMRLAKGRGV